MHNWLIISFTILAFSFTFATCEEIAWSALPYGGQFKQVSAKGDEVWAIDKKNQIFRLENGGDTPSWQRIATDSMSKNAPFYIAASEDGWTWALASDGPNGMAEPKLYRYNVDKKIWEEIEIPDIGAGNYCGKTLDALDKNLAIVAVTKADEASFSGCMLYTIIFVRKNDNWLPPMPPMPIGFNGYCYRVPACFDRAAGTAIGNKDNRYLAYASPIDFCQFAPAQCGIRHYNSTIKTWEDIGGSVGMGDTNMLLEANRIFAQNANRVLILDRVGQLTKWDGKKWKVLMGVKATSAAITDKYVYYTDSITSSIFYAEV